MNLNAVHAQPGGVAGPARIDQCDVVVANPGLAVGEGRAVVVPDFGNHVAVVSAGESQLAHLHGLDGVRVVDGDPCRQVVGVVHGGVYGAHGEEPGRHRSNSVDGMVIGQWLAVQRGDGISVENVVRVAQLVARGSVVVLVGEDSDVGHHRPALHEPFGGVLHLLGLPVAPIEQVGARRLERSIGAEAVLAADFFVLVDHLQQFVRRGFDHGVVLLCGTGLGGDDAVPVDLASLADRVPVVRLRVFVSVRMDSEVVFAEMLPIVSVGAKQPGSVLGTEAPRRVAIHLVLLDEGLRVGFGDSIQLFGHFSPKRKDPGRFRSGSPVFGRSGPFEGFVN